MLKKNMLQNEKLAQLLKKHGFLQDERGMWYRLNEKGEREEPYMISEQFRDLLNIGWDLFKKYSGPKINAISKKKFGKITVYSINYALENLPKRKMMSDFPHLKIEYSAENKMPATCVPAGTPKKLKWICSRCGHKWEAVGQRRKSGSGCPACSGRVATKKKNLSITHPELAKEYSPRNILPADQVLAGSGKKFIWICSKCGHEWEARGICRVRGKGCPACSGRVATKKKNLSITHPELAKEYSPRNILPADQVLAGSGKKFIWICGKCGHEWEATGDDRVHEKNKCICQMKRPGRRRPKNEKRTGSV